MKNIKIGRAFILGILVSGLGVYALNINARDTAYDNTNSGSTATNMQDAIDDLYDKSNSGNTNIGDSLIPIMNSAQQDGITITAKNYESASTLPYMAFDGNISTCWRGAYPDRANQWLQVDFGDKRVIKKITAAWKGYNQNTTWTYNIQVSNDGTNWINILPDNMVGLHTSVSSVDVYANHEARYVRFWLASGYTDGGGIYDMQVYGY